MAVPCFQACSKCSKYQWRFSGVSSFQSRQLDLAKSAGSTPRRLAHLRMVRWALPFSSLYWRVLSVLSWNVTEAGA